MRENEKAAVFTGAIDLLTDRAVAAKCPASPGAYAATVRADLRERMYPVAKALFAEHDDVTADELATLLEAHEKPSTLVATAPAYTADQWERPSAQERMTARQRLSQIRESLQHQETQ